LGDVAGVEVVGAGEVGGGGGGSGVGGLQKQKERAQGNKRTQRWEIFL